MPCLPRSTGERPDTSPPQGDVVIDPSTDKSSSSRLSIRSYAVHQCRDHAVEHDPLIDMMAMTAQRVGRVELRSLVDVRDTTGTTNALVTHQYSRLPLRPHTPVNAPLSASDGPPGASEPRVHGNDKLIWPHPSLSGWGEADSSERRNTEHLWRL